jgi:hypothetical protein
MKKTSLLILLLILLVTFSANCQLAVGYNTDGNTISLSTNPLHKLWGEIRVNTKGYNQAGWSYSERGITQAYIVYTLFSAKSAGLYTGGGLGMNLLSEGSDKWLSINIPVGLKMNPFSKIPDLVIFGEYNPMIIAVEDIPVIHSVSLGFRFVLSRKI